MGLSAFPASRRRPSFPFLKAEVVSCPVIYRPKKLTLKGYKQYWCTFKDITISCYKTKEEAHGTPAHQMNLRGEVEGGEKNVFCNLFFLGSAEFSRWQKTDVTFDPASCPTF